jgi:hypothetical protein
MEVFQWNQSNTTLEFWVQIASGNQKSACSWIDVAMAMTTTTTTTTTMMMMMMMNIFKSAPLMPLPLTPLKRIFEVDHVKPKKKKAKKKNSKKKWHLKSVWLL